MAGPWFALAAGAVLACMATAGEGGGIEAVAADRGALPEDREQALAALRGTAGLDRVREMLCARALDPEEGPAERVACLRLCGRMGADALPLVPALKKLLAGEDPSPGIGLAFQTADALSRIAPGDETVFAAIDGKRLKDGSDPLESMWAPVLGRFGERAKPTLLAWLRSPVGPNRMWAVRGLSEAGAWARPHLVEALDDPEHWVAHSAVEALANSGAPASELVPLLLPRLDSKERRSVLSAMDLLGRQGADAAAAIPFVRAFDPAGDPYAAVVAAHTLFRLTGEVEESRVLAVAGALGSTVPVQSRAAEALRDFGPRSAPAIAAMAKGIRRTGAGVRERLAEALAATCSKDAVAPLRGVLRGERDADARIQDRGGDHRDVVAALRGLVALGAKDAVPDIRAVAGWKSEPDSVEMRRLRKHAEEALAALAK
ncbi:MAG TPA: HEAT repeat domain-containing protein [Planctomycetota bacterium]|nr:HEAT repeat domain-containing protein [Planctomycetota bacterium]